MVACKEHTNNNDDCYCYPRHFVAAVVVLLAAQALLPVEAGETDVHPANDENEAAGRGQGADVVGRADAEAVDGAREAEGARGGEVETLGQARHRLLGLRLQHHEGDAEQGSGVDEVVVVGRHPRAALAGVQLRLHALADRVAHDAADADDARDDEGDVGLGGRHGGVVV